MKFLWIFLTIIVLLGGVIVKRMSVYPFTAIVGQDDMKMSLILNVINPSLGGVLIKRYCQVNSSTCFGRITAGYGSSTWM